MEGVKLRPTKTAVKVGIVGSDSPGSALLQFWCEDEGFTRGDASCMAARHKFFSSNLSLVVGALPPEVVVPTFSYVLSLKEIQRLIGLWGGKAPSAFLFPEMNAFVKEHSGGGRVILKLGSRSAKDVTFTHPRTFALYRTSLDEAKISGSVPRFQRLELLYRAQIDCLCCSSLQEALELFCQSTRVLFDLELDLLDPVNLHTTLECRPWLSNASLESEWRVFVRGGQIVAISQYFTDLYFPRLVGQANHVKDAILKVWNSDIREPIVKRLGLKNCVVDFICDLEKCLVLEVNQWARSTGSGLFSWDELEREQYSEEPEIRFLRTPPNVKSLPPEWLEILDMP
jgi:hypothetical protein